MKTKKRVERNPNVLNILLNWKMLIFWIIIVSTVFLAHYFSGFLEQMVVAGNQFAWVLLFLWYLAFVAVIGTIFAYIIMKLR